MTDKKCFNKEDVCGVITVEEIMNLSENQYAPSKKYSFMFITYKLWNELMKNEDNKKLVKSLINKGD